MVSDVKDMCFRVSQKMDAFPMKKSAFRMVVLFRRAWGIERARTKRLRDQLDECEGGPFPSSEAEEARLDTIRELRQLGWEQQADELCAALGVDDTVYFPEADGE